MPSPHKRFNKKRTERCLPFIFHLNNPTPLARMCSTLQSQVVFLAMDFWRESWHYYLLFSLMDNTVTLFVSDTGPKGSRSACPAPGTTLETKGFLFLLSLDAQICQRHVRKYSHLRKQLSPAGADSLGKRGIAPSNISAQPIYPPSLLIYN